jgi:hypothetical protein
MRLLLLLDWVPSLGVACGYYAVAMAMTAVVL